MHKISTKTKFILLTIACFILIFAIVWHYLHSATLIIQIAPTDATILLNGSPYQNGLHNLAPKKDLEVTISAENFETKTFTINLEYGKVTNLFAYLLPQDNNWDIYISQSHQESLNLLLADNGYQYWNLAKTSDNLTLDQDNSADNLIKKLSIKTLIPIQFSVCGKPANRLNCNAFSIDYNYSPDCGNNLCLIITSREPTFTDKVKQNVQDKLTSLGYNFSDYLYTYKQADF